MRRPIISSSLALLLALTVSAQKKSDRERDELLGAVRSVRTEIARVALGGVEGPRVPSSVLTYDAQGNKSELALYDHGHLRTRVVYSRDPQANRLAGWTIYNDKNSLLRRVANTYSDYGMIARQEQINYNPDGSIFIRKVISYDSLGGLIKVAEYNADGSPVDKRIPVPDDGEQQSESPIDDPGRPGLRQSTATDYEVLEKDARGNWIKVRLEESEITSRHIYEGVWVFYRTISYY